ncbi:hypothetical protein HMPREF9630_01540 [Peptoanaerobacter stomatis]|uniref:Uncharacterized protein n=1 Tax=Peptoanaerobacter stomatis TaxID=796937 RepID=V9HQE7_9FIRM|nr:hypothetical protein HMPREF9630_01540 [Peptoanaerobacter stomatis]
MNKKYRFTFQFGDFTIRIEAMRMEALTTFTFQFGNFTMIYHIFLL